MVSPTASLHRNSASEISKGRKRVLFVAHSGFQGGAELCLDTLLRRLDDSEYKATVLFPWEGPMSDSARCLGLPLVVRPLNWWMCWGFSFWYFKTLLLQTLPNILWLVRYIRQNHIDLVYSNSAVIFEAAIAARIAGVPHIWHVHEVLKPGNVTAPVLPLWLIRKMIGWMSQRIIFESNTSRNVYADGRPDPKTTVVYNCVRFPNLPTTLDPKLARQKLGFDDDEQVVSFIGQFSERKNPSLLVRAAARIADRSRLRFVFVGDGPLREELQRTIDSLGLAECCQILPFQEDITWVLAATDVLVLPSRQESFGLVLVEAAALGKPAIATRTEGPSEIIVDGVTGFLVAPEDEIELAQKLIEMFGPSVDRQRMGQAASRRAREMFSAAEYAAKIEGIIDELLAKANGGRACSNDRVT